MIFRIFQEILTNIARHAQASFVDINIRKTNCCLVLEVRDNGRGITDEEVWNQKSFGLRGIRERLLMWQGTLNIQAHPEKGTIVAAEIPLWD